MMSFRSKAWEATVSTKHPKKILKLQDTISIND
jgi:hypothetical protein